jgi:hypothetical protein
MRPASVPGCPTSCKIAWALACCLSSISQASKSQLGWDFITVIETGRYREFHPLDEEMDRQLEYCQYSILDGPSKTMRWGVPQGQRDAKTGDVEMKGVFDPSHIAFALANTTTLADMAVNAMNKIVIDLYTNLSAYRWFEPIVAVQATDGSMQDMQWLQFGGIGNLPVVAEGAAYTELSVVDTKESSSFTKYGGYVGITDKMIRNSEIDRLQAIPRALTISAIRIRSAAIPGVFSQASGLGPTLAQDSKALFVADNSHSNYATTALSIAGWAAARLECMKQAELGSSKRQVLWPKFLLVPVDLYDTALVMFGYGAGLGRYPVTPNNDVNPYAQDRPGDPRPVVIAVPEWTDATDWAYIVDPRIAPVICIAYGDNPGRTSHPAPRLYSVTDPTSGLLFTNDTLPIKVRDLWAYGVATYRGIGKRIVAG